MSQIKTIETLAQPAASAEANEALRKTIYAGHLYRLPASSASLALVAAVIAGLEREFGAVDYRSLQHSLAGDELYQRMGKVRKALFADSG